MNENSENLEEFPRNEQPFVNEPEQFPREIESKPQENLQKEPEASSIIANGMQFLLKLKAFFES